ncbi:MAG: glycosyltransferase family 39 protein [Acidimicrobiia bacterium]
MIPADSNATSAWAYRVLVVVVVAAALAFRFQGIWFGYPLAVHPDEHNLVERAWSMIWTKDLSPEFFIYPTFNIYLQAALQAAVTLVLKLLTGIRFSEIPLITFYLAGRISTVLLSAATVYLVFRVARLLVHPLAGLGASIFLGASYLHVTNSFLVTVDAPAAFWAVLATWMAALVYARAPRPGYYLLAGLFAGLAAGSKYIAVFALLPLLVAHAARALAGQGWLTKNLALALAAAPAAFLATSPYILLDLRHFLQDMQGVTAHYRGGHAGNEAAGDRSWHLYAGNLFRQGYGAVPSVLAAVGIVWLGARNWRKLALLASFPVALFIFVGSYKVFFPRNLVPLVPFLAVLSGAGLYALARSLTVRVPRAAPAVAAAALALAAAAVVGQAASAQARITDITLPDTRWLALQWMESHLPAGTCIAREGGTPVVESYTDRYRVAYLGYTDVFDELARAECADYLILSSFNYGRFLGNETAYAEEAGSYRSYFRDHQPVAEFTPDSRTAGGPTIRIYQL